MHTASTLIRWIFDQAFNQGNLAIIDELVAVNGVTHASNWDMPGSRLRLKQLISTYHTGFPDLHCTTEDEIYKGDRLAAFWTMHGTHKGRFMGNPPTGRSIMVHGITFTRTENNQIVEDWTLIDQLGIL